MKLPEGRMILPGIVSHATNVVEHPELVAERIERFASLVGRENVWVRLSTGGLVTCALRPIPITNSRCHPVGSPLRG